MDQVGKRRFGASLLAVGFALIPVGEVRAAPVTEEEAHAIGVDAYLYFYPLMTMEITRQQLTNQEPGPGSLGGPVNRFANIPAFPSADMKAVVRPNFDTLYSSAGLTSRRNRWSCRCPTLGAGTTCYRCSICGRTCSRRPAGVRQALPRAIF